MNLPTNLKAGFISLVLVIVLGTTGFIAITGLGIGDAVYVTIITITTLGFGNPIGELTGGTKLWIVIVLLSGMGAALYTVTAVMEYGFEIVIGSDYRRLRRMNKKIERAKDHVIVCGYGRVGSTVAAALDRQGMPFLVVEDDPDRIANAIDSGWLVVDGDATRDEVLVVAGLEKARSVIACVASSSDNLVITLSVKAIRADIAVFARAIDSQTEKKLILAGADAVVTPELVGGERIAAFATQPDLADFVDTVVAGPAADFQIRSFVVAGDSRVVGKSLADLDLRKEGGAMVVSMTEPGQAIHTNPDPHRPMSAHDVVFGIGTQRQLAELRTLLESP